MRAPLWSSVNQRPGSSEVAHSSITGSTGVLVLGMTLRPAVSTPRIISMFSGDSGMSSSSMPSSPMYYSRWDSRRAMEQYINEDGMLHEDMPPSARNTQETAEPT